eukprot:TRINITY_DN63451_c1_g8_i1.p1 TRINITY_DN63451_c1_g8~~TRINITY_DN63451_c1_g8_i1.p1  ORF type:complete len:335 (-),score=169.89 TRINITY_DN63451_c1_g8_i1:57-1061(-)
MSFLFSKKKTPASLVKSCVNHLESLGKGQVGDKAVRKSAVKMSSNLQGIKVFLYGSAEAEAKKETQQKMADELFGSDVLAQVVKHLDRLQFEARKDVALVYTYVLRHCSEQSLKYFADNEDVLLCLVKGYEDKDLALCCGAILRECVRHEAICRTVLYSKALFHPFFEYVQLTTFDVASDAFATFKAMLTKHKALSAEFLEKTFDETFEQYNGLLLSKNYVAKRQSLKLLGELLLDRSNFKIMMKYINSPANLKIMMNLLRGHTKVIQFEAFHVFKIFVANPQKSKPITDILLRNRQKLIEFLKKFQTDKDDDQFIDEKKILLQALDKLEPVDE